MAVLTQALIPVTNAAFVAVTAKTMARGVRIAEDGSGSAAGLVITWANGTVAEYPPSQQPILVGEFVTNLGPLVGVPANYNGSNNPATQYCTVKSMGANTVVRVDESN